MLPQSTSSTAAVRSHGLPFSISKPALIKLSSMLVILWLIVTFHRFSTSHSADIATGPDPATASGSQETVDVVIAVNSDSETLDHKHDINNADPLPTFEPASEPKQQPAQVSQHTDRAAMIIETRPLKNLIPVILHFHSVLGPEWPIIFYTIPETVISFSTSAPFSRAVTEGRIIIRYLPQTVIFDAHRDVSLFLTEPWIWEDLAPYSKILMFQDDSILCSASSRHVDDFLEWDLIGAPIDRPFGEGFNGGLSLRTREIVLDIVKRYNWADDSAASGVPVNMKYEDQWLFVRMLELPAKPDGSPGARLPTEEIASQFAVETRWSEEPLGFHQPLRWQRDKQDRIREYCPEIGMIREAAFS